MSGVGKSSDAAGLRLQGKVAVITGGASGIGEATARLFAAQGAKLIVADIDDAAGERLARDLGGAEVARFIHCDVRKEEEIAAAVDLSVAAYGGLDIMFNNAGIIGPTHPIDRTPAEELDNLYNLNLRGVFLGIKHAARIMKPVQKGSIISTASIAAHAGGQASHAYTAFKHALIGLTRSAACELRNFQIRVNAVSPGGVATNIWDQIPGIRDQLERICIKPGLQSVITPVENIASAVLFLASNDAAYVSGQALLVDGSHTLAPDTPHLPVFFRNGAEALD